jgi:hypothetical protein
MITIVARMMVMVLMLCLRKWCDMRHAWLAWVLPAFPGLFGLWWRPGSRLGSVFSVWAG